MGGYFEKDDGKINRLYFVIVIYVRVWVFYSKLLLSGYKYLSSNKKWVFIIYL